MKITLFIAQYPVSYAGELMPNVVDAWDEFAQDENLTGFNEAVKKHEALARHGTYEAFRLMDVTIPDDAVTSLFVRPSIKGVI